MKIKLIKFNDELITPKRAHYNDAGLDCYSPCDLTLEPHKVALLNLGFGVELPDGIMAVLKPRSSFNVKGIYTGIGTIDSGYRGEIKASFVNLTDEPIEIKKGDRVCQIVFEPVIIADLVDKFGEERLSGGFGSSGK